MNSTDDSDIKIADTNGKPPTALDIALALAEPFDEAEVHFKPAAVSGNRALAIAYVDARTIQDRLDQVLGVDGWQDDYECLADGSVVCRLRLRFGSEWITKVDVGGQSEQQDGGDRLKAAFSDALKRVAVKFGVGRYLYRLSSQWVDYDPQRKQFKANPKLPNLAIPGKNKPPCAKPDVAEGQTPVPNGTPTPVANAKGPKPRGMPANGAELEQRLADYDARLAEQGLCMRGDLLSHIQRTVSKAGPKPGYGLDVRNWPERAIVLAIEATRAFEEQARAKEARRRDREERLITPPNGRTNHS